MKESPTSRGRKVAAAATLETFRKVHPRNKVEGGGLQRTLLESGGTPRSVPGGAPLYVKWPRQEWSLTGRADQ